MASDPVRKTYWVYTDSSLFELGLKNETRDIWRIYLEKGNFNEALQYAKVITRFTGFLLVLYNFNYIDGGTPGSSTNSSGKLFLQRRQIHTICTELCSVLC